MDSNETFVRPEEQNVDFTEDGLPQDLLAEIDEALEGLTSVEDESEAEPEIVFAVPDGLSLDPGMRQMQETFIELARNTLSPIDRYMKAISLGENARDLLEISELIVTPLIHKTESVGLYEHTQDLTFFRSLLLLALGERDQESSDAMKEVVMEGFNKLSDRFQLGCRGYRLAVRNLVGFYRDLRTNDSVSEADIRRFFAIGVPSLTWVRRTKASDLSSLSGIAEEIVKEIRHLAFAYRSSALLESASLATDDPRAPQRLREPRPLAIVTGTGVAESDVFGATSDLDVTSSQGDN